MPPHDHDRTTDSDLPALGEWAEEFATVPTAALEAVFCRRCGETSVPVESCCPWCGAWLVGEPPTVVPVYPPDEPEDDWHTRVADEATERYAPRREPKPLIHPLVVVFVSYGLLLGSLIVFLVYAVVSGITTQEDLHAGLAVVEIADAVLTLAALGLVRKAAKQKLPAGTMGLTWFSAFPVLFALLCLNLAYITFLRELLRGFGAQQQQEGMKFTLATVLLVCVQPAIVEELFFRQMTLGVFRRSMNLHIAIWVTAGLFAFAHLTNPVGMPYLFLAGGVFGYARAFGGLTLAMVLHFLHNLAVVSYEALK
jgi:membrane protease YdiL (CAAX protease family)